MENKGKNVAVFCASGKNVPKEHIDFAEEFGRELGRAGFNLVWGGCNSASMGSLARGVQSAHGWTIGVILRSMKEHGLAYANADELIVVENLCERKARIKERADAFVMLPGGIGTLDEFISLLSEQIVEVRYGGKAKKLLVVNWKGFYSPLEHLLEGFYKNGFADSSCRNLYRIVPDIRSAIAYLQQ